MRTAFGQTASDNLTDARALSLFAENAPRAGGSSGKVSGATFEIEVPWSALGWDKPPDQFRGLIRVERPDGAAIQSPVRAAKDDPKTWLTLPLAH